MGFSVPLSRTFLCLLLILLGLMVGEVFAQEDPISPLDPFKAAEQLEARRQTLEEDKVAIERTRQEVHTLATEIPQLLEDLEADQLTETMVEQARVDVESARLRQENLQVEIANVERRIQELEQSIRALEAREQLLKNPAKDDTEIANRPEQLERTSQTLAQRKAWLELEKQHLDNLRNRLELATQRLSLVEQKLSRLEELYLLQLDQSRREAQLDLEQRLQQEQQVYLNRATELSKQLEHERETLSEARRRLLETSIQVAETRTKLIELDIRLARIENDLAHLEGLANTSNAQPKELQEGLRQLQDLQSELRTTEDLFQRTMTLTEKQKQVIEQRKDLVGADKRAAAEEVKILDEAITDLNQRQEQIQELLARAETIQASLEESYKISVSKDLLERRQLPATAEEWRQLVAGIIGAPRVIFYQVRLSVASAVETMADTTALRWMGLIALELGLFWLVMQARRALDGTIARASAGSDSYSFVSNLSLILFLLLRRNLLAAGLSAAVLIAVWIAQVPQPGLGIITILVLLWLAIKVPIDLARLLLASSRLPVEQRHPELYRQASGTLFIGGILAAMTILAHLSSLPEMVRDAFDRMFMLYLLLMFVLVLRVRHSLHARLAERYTGHHWFIILHLVTLLLPLPLLGAALLGLIGYLALAWAVAWHLVAFILVLVGWLIARALLNDLVVFLKNYAVSHSGYGLLWTQEIIKPLHRIVGVILFLGAWIVLFRAYGWDGESAITANLWEILERPLFTLGGADITLWRIIITVVTFLIVVWFGQWSRAITYRWVYSGIVDLGVRHSLSVFTQYFIVLIGVLLTLRIIGLDLTTLTIFAGAVGVGIGFGMQAIANNFISGLILLVERPLRSGDLVQIGTNTGEIDRIGIRSLTLKTFDNQEVIIPNSEVITHSFTNWTHHDNIMRTVLRIGVSYEADPHHVKTVLERILNANPAIVRDPAPMVLLWEYTDFKVHFWVHYYMDIVKNNLLELRSQVMFAIWDAFKKEGIQIPYPQQDLYIKEWPAVADKAWHDEASAPQPILEKAEASRLIRTPSR